jgi:hypothetical protein
LADKHGQRSVRNAVIPLHNGIETAGELMTDVNEVGSRPEQPRASSIRPIIASDYERGSFGLGIVQAAVDVRGEHLTDAVVEW